MKNRGNRRIGIHDKAKAWTKVRVSLRVRFSERPGGTTNPRGLKQRVHAHVSFPVCSRNSQVDGTACSVSPHEIDEYIQLVDIKCRPEAAVELTNCRMLGLRRAKTRLACSTTV